MKERDRVEEFGHLSQLRLHPGFALLCEEMQRRFNELTGRMHDLNTPAIEAEQLRQARGRIEQLFFPAKILDDLLTKTEAHAKRQIADAGTPT